MMSRAKIASYYYNLGRQKAAQDMLGGRTKTAAKISPAMLKRLGIGAGVGAGVGGGAYGINKLLAARAAAAAAAAAGKPHMDALKAYEARLAARDSSLLETQLRSFDGAMSTVPKKDYIEDLVNGAIATNRSDAAAAAAKMDALMGGSPSSIGRMLSSSKDPEFAANLLGLPEAGSFRAQLARDAAARATGPLRTDPLGEIAAMTGGGGAFGPSSLMDSISHLSVPNVGLSIKNKVPLFNEGLRMPRSFDPHYYIEDALPMEAAEKFDALMSGSPSSIGRMLSSSKDPEFAANLLGLPEAGSFRAQLARDAARASQDAAAAAKMDALMSGSPSSIGRMLSSSKDPEFAANLLGL